MHAATHFENNMNSEMEVTSYSKGKGKIFFKMVCFYAIFYGAKFWNWQAKNES